MRSHRVVERLIVGKGWRVFDTEAVLWFEIAPSLTALFVIDFLVAMDASCAVLVCCPRCMDPDTIPSVRKNGPDTVSFGNRGFHAILEHVARDMYIVDMVVLVPVMRNNTIWYREQMADSEFPRLPSGAFEW